MAIYTRNKAAQIVEMFEDVLNRYSVRLPSPEDSEREDDNCASLYGSTYYGLLDEVECLLNELLSGAGATEEVIEGMFSGAE